MYKPITSIIPALRVTGHNERKLVWRIKCTARVTEKFVAELMLMSEEAAAILVGYPLLSDKKNQHKLAFIFYLIKTPS